MLKLNHLTGFGSGAGAGAAAATPTSYVFDGTNDSLIIPDSADWDIFGNADDKTIDFWIKLKEIGAGGENTIFLQNEDLSNSNNLWLLAHDNNNGWWFGLRTGASWVIEGWYGATISDRDWHHIALCKVGTEYGLYQDGVQGFYINDATTDTYAAPLIIGDRANDMDGYLDDIRIYDGNPFSAAPNATPNDTIVVPTAQHTSDANTLLLIHGGEAYTGALTGETTQSCVTFDGSGDYLTIPDSADWEISTSSEYTIEFWVRHNAAPGDEVYFQHYQDGSNYGFYMRYSGSSGGVQFFVYLAEVNHASMTTSDLINDTDWHHIAVTKTSGDLYTIWVDGVDSANATDSDSGTTAGTLYVGMRHDSTRYLNGSMAGIRFSDTDRYPSDFSASLPTERFTSDANTLLLIHGDENGGGTTAFTDSGNTGHTVTPTGNAFLGNGGTFTDSGNTGHTVSENGQAQRETEQEFKFADDGVGYFLDGNDYLSVADSGDWDFSTGDFSIEGFFRWNDVTAQTDSLFTHEENDSDPYWVLQWASGTGKFTFISNFGGVSSIAFDTWTPTVNTWYHIGLARASGTLYLEVDGVAKGDGAFATDVTGIVAALEIGGGRFASDFQGHMDEVRISDTDRRSEWPPATQYASDANTLLLIHGGETKSGTTGSGATFTDSGNTGHTVTEVGNAIESTGNFYKF